MIAAEVGVLSLGAPERAVVSNDGSCSSTGPIST